MYTGVVGTSGATGIGQAQGHMQVSGARGVDVRVGVAGVEGLVAEIRVPVQRGCKCAVPSELSANNASTPSITDSLRRRCI